MSTERRGEERRGEEGRQPSVLLSGLPRSRERESVHEMVMMAMMECGRVASHRIGSGRIGLGLTCSDTKSTATMAASEARERSAHPSIDRAGHACK